MASHNPNEDQKICCTLLTSHALSIMEKHVPQLQLFLESLKDAADRYGQYPDGTMLFEGGDSFHRLWNRIKASRRVDRGVPEPNLLMHGIWHPNSFGGLEEFTRGKIFYMLFYTRDYRESLGELDFSVVFPSMWAHPTKDYNLKNLLISIGFTRKVSTKTQQDFAQCLEEFFSSVSSSGILNEGPLKLVFKEIEFRGRLAQFRVDSSSAGQDTLNWLLITALNFGYSTSTISDFVFDHDKDIERFIGPVFGKVQKIVVSTTPWAYSPMIFTRTRLRRLPSNSP